MNIAIIGYGRMGKEIEKAAIQRGHSICCIIDNEQDWQDQTQKLKKADIAIEFSIPEAVLSNIERCHHFDLPVITGTTGWDKERIQIIEAVKANQKTLFFAPNFSIGVNLFFELNRRFTGLISGHEQYSGSISETHHIHKQDAPSGTAIALANDIIGKHAKYREWAKEKQQHDFQLPVKSSRENEIIGDHHVSWESPMDTIRLSHHAKNRSGFAIGAVIAGEWVKEKTGYYEMADMLFDND
ncbi:MAG: 4-hydroxy-tetrahydrodipicolinate reductase [Bacteroidales bacterium]